jgi:transcriptional regulator with XRE-family HTH domain
MNLNPERLISVRESMGINKTEAAKMLNMSAMGYGRYESGQRSPSYQTICFIAQTFNVSPEYLCGETSDAKPETIIIDKNEDVQIFELVDSMQRDKDIADRLIAYYNKLISKMSPSR